MFRILATAACLAALSGPAMSASVFTDQAAFNLATSNGTVLDTYDDVTSDFFAPNEVINRTGHSLTNEASTTGFFTNNGTNDTGAIVIGFGSPAASLKFDLQTAAKAIFFDIEGTSQQMYNIVAGTETASISVGVSFGFFGIVFDDFVSSFTITDTDGIGNGNFDNFGVASVVDTPAVPLPASLPLLLGAFGLFAAYGRRKTA